MKSVRSQKLVTLLAITKRHLMPGLVAFVYRLQEEILLRSDVERLEVPR